MLPLPPARPHSPPLPPECLVLRPTRWWRDFGCWIRRWPARPWHGSWHRMLPDPGARFPRSPAPPSTWTGGSLLCPRGRYVAAVGGGRHWAGWGVISNGRWRCRNTATFGLARPGLSRVAATISDETAGGRGRSVASDDTRAETPGAGGSHPAGVTHDRDEQTLGRFVTGRRTTHGGRDPMQQQQSWTKAVRRRSGWWAWWRAGQRKWQNDKPDPIPETEPLKASSEQLKEAQRKDETLQQAWRWANGDGPRKDNVTFFIREGLLHRRWRPKGSDIGDCRTTEQLVLPESMRQDVMRLAHEIPLAGHMGKQKTTARILKRFYWPRIFSDVAEYVRHCSVCQRTARVTQTTVPMIPLPSVGVPFQRVATDIVGPLPKTPSGNRYILVVVDYATRYPEAVAMKSTDAETVAQELVKIFARLGIPDELLTDQGSNFVSELLNQLSSLLRIRRIKTSPYHPQTDGLVERFNGTLKRMLRRFVQEAPGAWDELLPYLLFSYREVPQASTGFSPFELFYGRHVRGPLDVLREAWTEEGCGSEDDKNVLSYITEVRDRLVEMADLAQENVETAQQTQKKYYDRSARDRSFEPGDQVLLLLPTSPRKLEAAWQGPFRVLRKLGPVDYEIELEGRRKKRRVVHVNMLKKWFPPLTLAGYVDHQAPDEDPEELAEAFAPSAGNSPSEESLGPEICDQLTTNQKQELHALLWEFDDVLSNNPGRTSLAEHVISTGTASPVRQRPYRLPYSRRATVRDELQKMLDMDIIQPSTSPWASPIVLDTKKDGSIRFCVDYRALNRVADFDAYPMPRVDAILDKVSSARYISTIDLTRGYWQIPLEEDSRRKSAFVTEFGLYEFKTMPFGLHGAPATFQRLMDRVLRGAEEFSDAFLDDIAVFSDTWEEHIQHLREVLTRLRAAGLTAKPKKIHLGMRQTTVLGYIVGNGVKTPEPAKTEAIAEFSQPCSKSDVRSFLGLTGYYRSFVPDYATISAPLSDATKKSMPTTVNWSSECDQAFIRLKEILSSDPVLQAPNFDKVFILQTDASEEGLGAVLSQADHKGQERPVAYISRKLLPREKMYSTIEKEALAIKWAMEKLKVYLLGREFVVQTDHAPLQFMERHANNARVARWGLALQPFRFSVRHRPGRCNQNADSLSRLWTWTFFSSF